MASNRDEQNGVTRRDFTTRVGAAAAGIVVGGELLGGRVQAASAAGRILGANDRVVVSQIGIRGQGNALKRGFAQLKNVEIKTLCDIDGNLAPSRINDERLKDVADVQAELRAGPPPRPRRQGHRRDRHRHAEPLARAGDHLGAAGRQARLRREAGVAHRAGKAGRWSRPRARYKKIVQVGTMNRSRPAVREAIKFMHDGGIGKVYMARGLCFKPRPSIGKYPDGPMAPGEKYELTVDATNYEPTYDAQYLSKVDYDLWLGPAPKRPFNRNRFHYNWHWHWDYGNGDTGNQGPHQFDIARWGLGKQEHPVKIQSIGGYFGAESSQETPDMHTTLFEYADGTILEFATRGEFTNDEGGQRIGNLFYGTKGWLWIDGDGRKWQSYFGPKNEKGPGIRRARHGGRQRSARADQHRVAALPELHRRDSRRRPEGADLRHPRGPPVVDAAAPGEHRVSCRPRR